jgi:hypothetical protein
MLADQKLPKAKTGKKRRYCPAGSSSDSQPAAPALE